MLALAINLELIYLLIAAGVVVAVVYFLRKFIVTKNDVDDEELDEREIAAQEVENMVRHEDVVLEEKDIEKEVGKEDYDLDDEDEEEEKPTKEEFKEEPKE